MPLIKSKSKKAFEENIATEVKAGKPVKQAVAIAYDVKGRSKKDGGGLYANIHAKRERIAEGSGEKMRKVGAKGAPTAQAFKEAAKTVKMKSGGVSLAVGRGEKLPVDKGAGLTAKGRAKYNRETGSNLKAPQPQGGSRKDSFCARMSGVVEHSKGDAPRAKASLKRWKCPGWQNMAYSGTVGTTVVKVQDFIDEGARRSGKLAEELTSEQVVSARRSLCYLLSNLINIGIQYWAINKHVIGLNQDQYIYNLPLGANDALNVLYRTMNRPTGDYTSSAGGVVANVYGSDINLYCQQGSANGNIQVFYGTDDPIYAGSIGIMPYVAGGGSQTWSYAYEWSNDAVTWNMLYDSPDTIVTDRQWIWTDIDPGANALYYRIRVYGGTTLALRQLYIGNNSREVMMARLNRDDYTNLPNKNFTANQPYQFWFNRTIPQPEIYLWPTPSTPFVQVVVWYSRQIMDVGDLTDELEVPQRWFEAVQMMLAHRMALSLPQVPMDRIQYLEGQADRYLNEAEAEERDRSPIYFAPNISVYTR